MTERRQSAVKSNLEALVPGLVELRSKERANRAFAFAGLTHTLCGVELRPMTPRHRLTLQLIRNAFVASAREPLAGDVFGFLWVLSPHYSRSLSLNSRIRQFLLRRRVKVLERGVVASEIRAYIVAQLQDLPESSTESGFDQSPWVHWAATDASWWLNVHGGFTLETYFETPYLVLQQLYRGWRVNNPAVKFESDGKMTVEDPQFINESDRLVGQWQLGFREAAAAIMRAQVYRLP